MRWFGSQGRWQTFVLCLVMLASGSDQIIGRYASDLAASQMSPPSGDMVAGRTTQVARPQGSLTYGYDAADQQTSLTRPGNRTETLGYDLAGQLTSLTTGRAVRPPSLTTSTASGPGSPGRTA